MFKNRNTTWAENLELCRHPCKLRRCTDDDLAESQIIASACWRNCASSLFTARTHTSLAFDVTSASKPRTEEKRKSRRGPDWCPVVHGVQQQGQPKHPVELSREPHRAQAKKPVFYAETELHGAGTARLQEAVSDHTVMPRPEKTKRCACGSSKS